MSGPIAAGPKPGTATPWNGDRVGRVGDGGARSHEEQIWNDANDGVFIITHDGSAEGRANVAAMLYRANRFEALLAERDALVKFRGGGCDDVVGLTVAESDTITFPEPSEPSPNPDPNGPKRGPAAPDPEAGEGK